MDEAGTAMSPATPLQNNHAWYINNVLITKSIPWSGVTKTMKPNYRCLMSTFRPDNISPPKFMGAPIASVT